MENKRIIPESELVLNPDGSLYHIKLKGDHIADNVIVVGDQERVERISRHFDNIEFQVQNREFTTHTGTFNGKRITVISSGIGTDNIDIVLNELDAAVNIDLQNRQVKDKLKSLNIIRIGTSGALQQDIPVDSFVVSEFGMGLDTTMYYYDYPASEEEKLLAENFIQQTGWPAKTPPPYFVSGNNELIEKIGIGMRKGITATAPGFYGSQGRELRLAPFMPDLNEKLTGFNFNGHHITNFEMETSALYGLSSMLGHRCCTVCAIIANRLAKQFSKNYKKTVDELITTVLERIATL
ncbi:nucleoside phosphorylase [Bacteroidales bacterium AH-315-I05]|nr:nucleoside phosphorylase [Bacteroidales bacterium AH-315-I05]